MSTLICFALKEETVPFRKMATGKSGIAILITGVGRQNAERSVRKFLAGGVSVPASRLVSSLAPPKFVLTCGFAGGLDPDLKLGDEVFEMPLAPSLTPPGGERVASGRVRGFFEFRQKLPAGFGEQFGFGTGNKRVAVHGDFQSAKRS